MKHLISKPYSIFTLVLLIVGFTLSGPTPLNGETQVSISVSDNLATIGDRINLKLLVKTTSNVDKIVIKTPQQRDYEILHQDDTLTRKQPNDTVFEKNIQISFFKTGNFNVGPFDIDLMKGQSIQETRQTNFVPVTVKSVLTEKDKDIKPLKDLIEIRGNPFYILKWVILLLVLSLIAVLVIYFILRARRKAEVQQPLQLSPLEELASAFKHLNEQQLIEKGKSKAHFLQLTQILKHFLHRHYAFNAEDLTTDETLDQLKKQELADLVVHQFQFLFNTSDLVKFAQFNPDIRVMSEIQHQMDGLITFYVQEQARLIQQAQAEEKTR